MPTKTAKPEIKQAFDTIKTKAKAAYDKGAAAFGEAKAFTKDNVDAAMESSRILSAGLKDIGEGYVAEGKTAFAALNADAKEFAAIKTPDEFFKLQSKIFSRNIGSAIEFYSKNTAAMVKLSKDSAEPLTKRVSAAVAAVRAPA